MYCKITIMNNILSLNYDSKLNKKKEDKRDLVLIQAKL